MHLSVAPQRIFACALAMETGEAVIALLENNFATLVTMDTPFAIPVMVPLTVMAQGQAGFGTTALNQLVTLWIKTSVKTTAVLTRTLAILNRKLVNEEYNELWMMYVGILVAAHTSRHYAHIVVT